MDYVKLDIMSCYFDRLRLPLLQLHAKSMQERATELRFFISNSFRVLLLPSRKWRPKRKQFVSNIEKQSAICLQSITILQTCGKASPFKVAPVEAKRKRRDLKPRLSFWYPGTARCHRVLKVIWI